MLILLKISVFATLLCLSKESEDNPFLLNFQQNDYKLNVERVVLANFSKQYVEDVKFKTFKYNRTCTAFNISMLYKVDMGRELELLLQAYRFASNEYRLFPMRFEVNFCEALSSNILGTAALGKCGSFRGCPIMKGINYTACNFTPDSSKFPPLIPTGRYMWHMKVLYRSVETVSYNIHAEVSRPFIGN